MVKPKQQKKEDVVTRDCCYFRLYFLAECYYLSSVGNRDNGNSAGWVSFQEPALCFYDLKNVITRPGFMPLCFAVQRRCSSTVVHKLVTFSSA
jgi:hypothetical protein